MREVADAERVQRFMQVLGREAGVEARVYFTGGTTAVLFGWRSSTIDIDIRVVPEHDQILRTIPRIKDSLRVNVELASPADFIPVLSGWEDRSPFIAQVEKLFFHHFDLYAQALAKVERSHTQDLEDIREMIRRQLIAPARTLQYFHTIEPELYRYPAIDPRAFRTAVEEVFGSA
jgi:hypothetical protein